MNQNKMLSGAGNEVNVSIPERLVSVSAGTFLLLRGLRKLSLLQMAAGGFLLYRGTTGHCAAYKAMGKTSLSDQTSGIEINTRLTIDKPKNEVYAFWRKLENLPLFMTHLESVTQLEGKRSHWIAKVPGNVTTLEWDAEVINEVENSLISWQSLPGATVDNSGRVEFFDLNGGKTELHVSIRYSAPLGAPGYGLSWLLNPVFKKLIRNDINGFKQYVESGKLSATGKEKKNLSGTNISTPAL